MWEIDLVFLQNTQFYLSRQYELLSTSTLTVLPIDRKKMQFIPHSPESQSIIVWIVVGNPSKSILLHLYSISSLLCAFQTEQQSSPRKWYNVFLMSLSFVVFLINLLCRILWNVLRRSMMFIVDFVSMRHFVFNFHYYIISVRPWILVVHSCLCCRFINLTRIRLFVIFQKKRNVCVFCALHQSLLRSAIIILSWFMTNEHLDRMCGNLKKAHTKYTLT